MADGPAAPLSGVGEHRLELGKEALTMALYVAICLLASLIAIPESAVEHTKVWGLIWGVTLGLAIAHWFAFRVSARMVGAGTIRSSDVELAGRSSRCRLVALPGNGVYSLTVLVCAVIIAALKNLLAGH